MNNSLETENKIFWVYIFAFFISLQYAVVTYSSSTYLSKLLHQENIWIIYTLGSVLVLTLNFSCASMLRKIRISKYLYHTIFLTIATSLLLYYTNNFYISSFFYILYYGLALFLFTLSSIILEAYSKNSTTGSTRGKYNAIMSGGFLLAPFISSFFINFVNLNIIFLLSTFFSFIALLIFFIFITNIPKIHIEENSFSEGIRKFLRNKDIVVITIAQTGISTFFVLMIIYLPFKLESLGISLTQYLSVLLPIALSPFLFMPPLLGYIEDKMKNEKEILILAYIGLIILLGVIAFTYSGSLLVWGILLFLARLCASSAEISTNSYFYKKIGKNDVSLISIFSSTESFATIIFTALFSYLLFFTDIKILFLSVSFFLCFVLVLVSKIHDTKNHEKHEDWRRIWSKAKQRAS